MRDRTTHGSVPKICRAFVRSSNPKSLTETLCSEQLSSHPPVRVGARHVAEQQLPITHVRNRLPPRKSPQQVARKIAHHVVSFHRTGDDQRQPLTSPSKLRYETRWASDCCCGANPSPALRRATNRVVNRPLYQEFLRQRELFLTQHSSGDGREQLQETVTFFDFVHGDAWSGRSL